MQQNRKQLSLGHRPYEYEFHLKAVFILRTHYPSGRTWANIYCSSGDASRVQRRVQDALFVWTNYLSGSSSGRIMSLVPVFMLETRNQTSYKIFAQVRSDE